MKKLFYSLLLAAVAVGFTSCDPTEDDGPDILPALDGVFILNQGSSDMNNACLAHYSYSNTENPLIPDYFYDVNKSKLGDNATDILAYGRFCYISLTGSNCIYKLDGTGKLVAKALFHTDPDLQGGVRYMAIGGNYIYATFYGGVVAKLAADDLKVVAKLNTDGGNLEGIVEHAGTLYVADSYSMVYNPSTGYSDYIYSERLITIDEKTFTVKGEIKVAPNPNKLIAYDGKIYLISWGNYADKGYSFQMIDPSQNKKVTELAVATDMVAANGKVYLINSVTDWNTWATTNNWFSYDIASGKIENASFMKNAPASLASDHISMMTADLYSGEIYIGTTRYTLGNGEIFRFSTDGTFMTKFDCGGQNPIDLVSIYY